MRKFLLLISAVAVLCSCRAITSITSLIQDEEEVVARVGEDKLYLSELLRYIPEYASPEDSAALAGQYINSWAAGRVFLQVASETLSPSEMDVSAELEDYRQSLIKYRYEQHFVNERLDTLITPAQVEAYYKAHQDEFMLERPILKVRFVDILKDSSSKDVILKMMSSSAYSDIERADTLAHSAALRYSDRSDTWTDAAVLAREFGTDWVSMMDAFKGGFIKMEPEGRGDMMAAYVCDILKSGVAPLDFCEPSIREIILSARKHDLLVNLERDLLEEAQDNKQFVTYPQ